MLRSLLVILFAIALSFAQNTEKEWIKKILKEQGALLEVQKTLVQQLEKARSEHPEVPASSWEMANQRIHSAELENRVADLWIGQFSTDELKSIYAFFKTSAGKKYYLKQSWLSQKGGLVAGLFGMEVYAELRKLHPNSFPDQSQSEANLKKMLQQMESNKGAR